MAVSVQAPLYPSLSMWHLNQPSTTFPVGYDNPTENAPYYNATPLEPSSIIPMYHQTMGDEQNSVNTRLSPLQVKHQEPTSASKASKLKRSMSTPNVRGQVSSDSAALSFSADKKRNKLGYHRTSVACGK